MNKMCVAMVALLLVIIAGGVYKFMFQGSVIQSTDGRIAIQLTAGEKDMVLQEMRAFLESVQQITHGATENNMQLIAQSARVVGKSAQTSVPGTLIGKLPMAFKKLGFDTHLKFDELALNAEDFGRSKQVLGQLSVLLENCVACHAAYRLELVKN